MKHSVRYTDELMTKNASQWKVESVRCTAFPVQDASFDSSNWWTDVVGEQPDQITTKPMEGTYQAQGSKLGGILQLSVQPIRMQWTLNPNLPDDEGESWQIPNVGGVDRVAEFLKIIESWLQVTPNLSRLAFGAVLLNIVDDTKTGYDQLDDLLPNVDVDSSVMRDFSYQVNRTRSSVEVEGVQINRLSKWSVAAVSPMAIQIQGGQQVVQKYVGEPVSAVRLEVDINNVPDPDHQFDNESAVKIFDELVSLGLEISTSGDVA